MRPLNLLFGAALTVIAASCSTSPDLFEATDTNDDGRLSTDEVEETLVKGVFENTDVDDDGVVSWEEWQTSNPGESSELFKDRDADGDGVVTMDELRTYADKKDIFGPVVEDLDIDRNGFISEGEAEAMRKKTHIIDAR